MPHRRADPPVPTAEQVCAVAVLTIARAAECLAVESGWGERGPSQLPGELATLPGWCYPLALCDGENEPAGADDVAGMERAWPIAHRAWAVRSLAAAASPLEVVLLDDGGGEWPACVVAIGEEFGQPQALAATMAGDDPDGAAQRVLADLAARGHPAGHVRAASIRPASISPEPERPARAPRHERRRRRGLRAGLRRGSMMAVLTAAIVFVLLPGGRPAPPQLPQSLAEALSASAGGGPSANPGPRIPAQANVASGAAPAPGGDDPLAGADITFAVPEGGFVELGQLVIPAIGLQTVYASGVHPDALTRGPGHWPGTPLPGQAGNAVLSGHRTTFTAPFADLDLLVPGNHIGVTLGQGAEVVYQVVETLVVPEAEYVEVVTSQPGSAAHELTLFACNPKGQSSERIIVRAQVEPPPAADTEQPPSVATVSTAA